jgi:predicted glutamine amidotransferase
MCIIFHNPDGRKLNKSHLATAYENNPHGHGFMWVEGGHLNIVKGIAKDFSEIWYIANQLSGFAYTLHLRWRTMGAMTVEQCHPFQILDKDNDGLDFGMVHNGTLFGMPKHQEKSDTQLFSEDLRKKILEKDPGFRLKFISKIGEKIGQHNKMVFMTSDNRTFFVNKNLGKMYNGIWYSNTYSLEKNYRNKPSISKIESKIKDKELKLPLPIERGRWVHKRKPMPKWNAEAR